MRPRDERERIPLIELAVDRELDCTREAHYVGILGELEASFEEIAVRPVAIALAATRPASQIIPIVPTNGDTSIQSIQTVTLSASTLTAGNFRVTARKRHAEIPLIIANAGSIVDYAGLCLEQVVSTVCLEWVVLCSTTSTGLLLGSFEVING